MTAPVQIGGATLYCGDAVAVLRTLPSASVHCVTTSPPYYGLRDYGVAGQIGLEATVADYVDRLVGVFREVRRVLRPDGVCWLNLGDSYAGGGNGGGGSFAKDGIRAPAAGSDKRVAARTGSRGVGGQIKRKDLLGVPWAVAFALRDDGWWLRSDAIWAKANGMPESVADRPLSKHEYVFLLSKSERYWFDAEAVRLPATFESVARLRRAMRARLDQAGGLVLSGGGYAPPGQPPHASARPAVRGRDTYGRHTLGDAVPPAERREKQRGHSRRHAGFNERWDALTVAEQMRAGAQIGSVWWLPVANYSGPHYAVMPDEMAAICILAGCPAGGGTVLDPFAGTGTTCLVANRLGRRSIGIELNPDTLAQAEELLRAEPQAGLPLPMRAAATAAERG